MNLYLLTQDAVRGYNTYDSCVVCAESEEEAQTMVPDTYYLEFNDKPRYQYRDGILWDTEYEEEPADEDVVGWPSHQSDVKVKLIGVAEPSVEKGIVIASFNAG